MIIDEIRTAIKGRATAENRDDYRIRGIWSVDCLFKPNPDERVFNYKFIVVQTAGQGCSYSLVRDYDVKKFRELIGKNYLDLNISDVATEVAVLDSLAAIKMSKPAIEMSLEGTSIDKTIERARITIEEALTLVANRCCPKVVNVGVVGNFIKELLDRDLEVVGSDFDPEIVGTKLFGKVDILDGKNTPRLVAEADLAIVTGMTLATETMDEIIQVARENDTRLAIFAETGANLADYMIEAGVDMVVSEPFPFYIYEGKSTIRIFRGSGKVSRCSQPAGAFKH